VRWDRFAPGFASFFVKLPTPGEQLAAMPRITRTSARSQIQTPMYQLFNRWFA